MTLSHLDRDGRPRMVDVSHKSESDRRAVAEGTILMSAAALAAIEGNSGPKGNVLATAELAGTMAAKRTPELIPLCHALPLAQVEVTAALDRELLGIRVKATVRATARTGVEMEALTAVAVALLTVYDMAKGVDKEMTIGPIVLLEKHGGTSGTWERST